MIVSIGKREHHQWRSQTTEKIRTSRGDYWNKQQFSSIASLFKMGAFLKGNKSLVYVAEAIFLGDDLSDVASFMCLLQMFYMAIVLYAPSLALNAGGS